MLTPSHRLGAGGGAGSWRSWGGDRDSEAFGVQEVLAGG